MHDKKNCVLEGRGVGGYWSVYSGMSKQDLSLNIVNAGHAIIWYIYSMEMCGTNNPVSSSMLVKSNFKSFSFILFIMAQFLNLCNL